MTGVQTCALPILIDCGKKVLRDSTTNFDSPVDFYTGPPLSFHFNSFSDQHPQIRNILQEFPAITSPVNLSSSTAENSKIFHRIETGDALPVYSKTRRLPEDKLQALKIEFNSLLEAGIIRPSKSPWSSPLHLVPKKKPGEWRDRKSTRLNSSHRSLSRMPSSA